MHCPNCPGILFGPEGGDATCADCGWGTPLTVELSLRIRKLEKRNGELIDAILTHRGKTPPGASNIDHNLWDEVL